MAKLIYTVGLPASGKTRWSKEYVNTHPGTVHVTKDDLREMLHCGTPHNNQNESFTCAIRDSIICEALTLQRDVIVDDTNFNPAHVKRFEELAVRHGAELHREDFTHVALNLCLERNMSADRVLRGRNVPDKVIRQMWSKNIRERSVAAEYDPSKPDCYLCDIDGTAAQRTGNRSFYDETRVYEDEPRKDVVAVVKALCKNANKMVIFVSGRGDAARADTERWLVEKAGFCDPVFLLMRKSGDCRPDTVVKKEIFDNNIKGKYNVLGVFDDRMCVARMWEEHGLTVFRVGKIDEDDF